MLRSTRSPFSWILALAGVAIILPGTVDGAGFQLMEQSVRGLGYGFAGSTAGYGDGSSVFYNPAALDRLETPVMSLGLHAVMPSARFSNEGSVFPASGMPVAGGNGGDGAETAWVPNFYYAQPLPEPSRLTFGLGLNAPFGLSTGYPDNWVGRYNALESSLITLNINPALSYRATEWLALGAGVSAVYADAELSQAVDFGSIAGVGPQVIDGSSTLKGDDWGFGWNAGALFTLKEGSYLGLAYRSKTDLTMDGDVDWGIPAPVRPIQAQGIFLNGGGKVDLTLPESATLGGSHRLSEKWVLLGEIAWNRWSRFDELRVVFDNPRQPDSVVEENWDDAWRVSLGTDYLLARQWTLRGGLTYDQSPVPDKTHRTPRIPDMDRYWLALGLGFNATENLLVDLGYVHIFVEDGDSQVPGSTGSLLVGSWESSVDIVGASITWKM